MQGIYSLFFQETQGIPPPPEGDKEGKSQITDEISTDYRYVEG